MRTYTETASETIGYSTFTRVSAGAEDGSSANDEESGSSGGRHPLNEQEFFTTYEYQPKASESIRSQAKEAFQVAGKASKHFCSPTGFKEFLFGFLPILSWLPNYSIKNYLFGDIISGITVAVMHIPQGMAYSMLAGTPAVNGLYMAFFPVIVYVFFCSSRHNSMGTFAVSMLMTGAIADSVIEKYGRVEEQNFYSLFSTSGKLIILSEDAQAGIDLQDIVYQNMTGTAGYTQTQVVVVISLAVGLIQLAMGILRVGVLSIILSDVLVSGFTTGGSIHVMTSQLKNIFGLAVPKDQRFPRLLRTQWFVVTHIRDSNLTAIIVSTIAMTIMAVNNDHLKPRVAKLTKVPIPIELLAVIFGTLTSYFLDLNRKYGLTIIGYLPTGLPAPEIPAVHLLPDVLVGSFVLAIVAYTITFSMAKLLGMKQNYQVDANQELFACGFGNIAGSFFRSGPIAASLSRSLIQLNVGGFTQVTSFFSCAVLLLILLFMGPLFYHLPNCILSSIILVALKGMFMQYKHFIQAWNTCKLDALVWMATFLGVVIIDIDIGLGIGVGLSLLTLVWRGQRPYASLLGEVPADPPIYVDFNRFSKAEEPPGVKIFEFTNGLHFANSEYFKNSLYKQTGVDPVKWYMEEQRRHERWEKEKRKASAVKEGKASGVLNSFSRKAHQGSRHASEAKIGQGSDSASVDQGPLKHPPPFSYLVINLKSVGFVDNSAVYTLKAIFQEYGKIGVVVVFAGATEPVLEFFRAVNIYSDIPLENFFPTLEDAVLCAKSQCLTGTGTAVDEGAHEDDTKVDTPEDEDADDRKAVS